MYRYDAIDKEMLADRVAGVPRAVRAPPGRRAHRGPVQAAPADERPLSAAARLHAAHRHPLRRAEPDASCASSPTSPRTYDKGYGHFTTRTNLQLHWIKLTRRAGHPRRTWPRSACTPSRPRGNCIRNITADPHAGATADEVDDPRVWAEAIRQWSTFHPEFSLPAAQVQDRGHRLAKPTARRPRSTTSACACIATTRRRAGLRGAGRRRAGAHALPRPDHPRAACRSRTCSRTCRRSCASTIATAGATTSGRRASRCWSPRLGAEEFARAGRGGVGRRPTRPRSTCRTPSSPASAPPSRRAASRPCRRCRRRSRRPRRRPGLRPLRAQQRQAAQGRPATPSSTCR